MQKWEKDFERIQKNSKEIKSQFDKTSKELKAIKRNIDNIMFCRLQKESLKNTEFLINTKLSSSNEITMMKALTHLSIIPIQTNDNKEIGASTDNDAIKYSYFLLSESKSKTIKNQLEPYEFWKTLLRFKGLEAKNEIEIK